MDFESVKSYLSKHLDSNGSSIYDHIAKVTKKIVEEKTENAFELFENISLMVKNQNNNDINGNNNDIETININEKEKIEIKTFINSMLTLYGKKKENDEQENKDEEEENEEEKTIDKSKCANILQHSELFKWCGISLNYEEMYQLQNTFISLISKFPNIQSCRFWGIIQAINNNYWIVETKLEEYPQQISNNIKQEEPGKGINEYVYFVTTNIENCEWIQLNDVSPEQIKKSKQIHCLFTGNLESKVLGRTYFEWNESILLRCQIGRITSSTILSPNEYYQKPEEENEENPFEMELNEEFAPLSIDDAINYESWIHIRPHLRLEGRIQKWIKPEEDEENDDEKNDEEKEATEEELEEEIQILQSISLDKNKSLKENENENDQDEENNNNNCWYIREFNRNIGKFEIVSICNKLWNGAKTIYLCNSKQFINIYIGNGIKYNDTYYTPLPPSNIQSQFNEFKEVNNDDNEENDENENQVTEIKKESMFVVQQEQMPPPPAENDENENNDENANDETEQE